MTTKDNRIIFRPVHSPTTHTATATACPSSGSATVPDEDKTSSSSTSPASSSFQTKTTTSSICHPLVKNKMHVSTDVVKPPRHVSSDQDQGQSSSDSNNSPTSYVTPPMSSSGTFDLVNGGTLLRHHLSDNSVEHLPSPINLRAADGGFPANSNSGLVNTPNLFVKKVRAHYQQHQRLQQQEQKQKRTQSYYAGSTQNYANGDIEIDGNTTDKNTNKNDTNNINKSKNDLPMHFRPESRSASEFRAADFLNEKQDYDFPTIRPVQRVVSVPIQSPLLKEKELHLQGDHLDSDDENTPSQKLKLEDIHEDKEVVVRPTTPVAKAAAAGITLNPKAANGNGDRSLELDHAGAIKTTTTTTTTTKCLGGNAELTVSKVDSNEPTVATFTTFESGSNKKQVWPCVKQIGEGSFSKVYLSASHQCAIKVSNIVETEDEDTKLRIQSSLVRELEILQSLKHPNVVQLIGSNSNLSHNQVIMALKYYVGGDLFSFLVYYKQQGNVNSDLLRAIFANVVSAVKYLHDNDICHRDIKLENVLLCYSQEQLARIRAENQRNPEIEPNLYSHLVALSDFGLSKKIDPLDPLLSTRCGSEDYVSPELLLGMKYDGKENDCWSLGVLLYTMLEDRLPFDPLPNKPVRRRTGKNRPAHRIALISWDWYYLKDDSVLDESQQLAKKVVDGLLIKRTNRATVIDVFASRYCSEF
ncbi:unnamed protein product [Ambrosiozyma monospora]|uniref:Unnamed protein product n=1 Tax=Ambrosiozyma monospora TaxID=43982 RepID=A0A9W6Z0C0_AMBMO|nr:unnamed protein product [Ambrosiozyma monospora]